MSRLPILIWIMFAKTYMTSFLCFWAHLSICFWRVEPSAWRTGLESQLFRSPKILLFISSCLLLHDSLLAKLKILIYNTWFYFYIQERFDQFLRCCACLERLRVSSTGDSVRQRWFSVFVEHGPWSFHRHCPRVQHPLVQGLANISIKWYKWRHNTQSVWARSSNKLFRNWNTFR